MRMPLDCFLPRGPWEPLPSPGSWPAGRAVRRGEEEMREGPFLELAVRPEPLWEALRPETGRSPEEAWDAAELWEVPLRLSFRPWAEPVEPALWAPEVPEPSGRRMLRCSLDSMRTASFAEKSVCTQRPGTSFRANENRRPRTAMVVLYHNTPPQVQ